MSASAGRLSSSTITVCLVEDHQQVRDQLVDLLTDAGMLVLAAVGTVLDGRHAVSALRPDVAVIDNNLPDGRGTELCRTLAQIAPDVTVVIHTAIASDAVQRDALDAGAVAVVHKSIRSDRLLDAIRTGRGPRS